MRERLQKEEELYCIPGTKLTSVIAAVKKNYPNLDDISIPSLREHVTIERAFSLKRASLYNGERDVERTL